MTSHLTSDQRETIHNGLRVAAVLMREHGDAYLATVKRGDLPHVIKELLETFQALEEQTTPPGGRRKISIAGRRGSGGGSSGSESAILRVIRYILQVQHDWVSVNETRYLLIDRRQALLGLVPHLSPDQFTALLLCANDMPGFKEKVTAARFVQIRSILQRYTTAAGDERRRIVATVSRFPEILQGDWFLGFIKNYIGEDTVKTGFMSYLVAEVQASDVERLSTWVAENKLTDDGLYSKCFNELTDCLMMQGLPKQELADLPKNDDAAVTSLLDVISTFLGDKPNKAMRIFFESLRDRLSDQEWQQRPKFAALYVICYELVTGADTADESYCSRMGIKIAALLSTLQPEQISQFATTIDILLSGKDTVLSSIVLRAVASCKSVADVEKFESLFKGLNYQSWCPPGDELWKALFSVSSALTKRTAISAKLLQFFVEQDASQRTQLALELVEVGFFNKRQSVSVGHSVFATEGSDEYLVLVDSVGFSAILNIAGKLKDKPLHAFLALLAEKIPLAQLSAMSAWMEANGLEESFAEVYQKIAARKANERLPQYQALAEMAGSEVEGGERTALLEGLKTVQGAADELVAYWVTHVASEHSVRLCGDLVRAEVEAYNYADLGGGVLRGNSFATKLLVAFAPAAQYRAALMQALARDVEPLLPKLLDSMDVKPAWATGESRPAVAADMDKATWLLNVILKTVESVVIPDELQQLCQDLYAGICKKYKAEYAVDGQLAEAQQQALEKFALSQVMGIIMLRVVTPVITELTRKVPVIADQSLLKLVNAIMQSLANQKFTKASMLYPPKTQLAPLFRRLMGVAYRVAHQLPVTGASDKEAQVLDRLLTTNVAESDTTIVESSGGPSLTKLKLLVFACLNLRVYDHAKHTKKSRDRRSSSGGGSAGVARHARSNSMAAVDIVKQVAIERARAESTHDKQTAVIELARTALDVLLLADANSELAGHLQSVLETAMQDAIDRTSDSTQKFLMAALKQHGCSDCANSLDPVLAKECQSIELPALGATGTTEVTSLGRSVPGIPETRKVLTRYLCACAADDPVVGLKKFKLEYFSAVYSRLTTQTGIRAILNFTINSMIAEHPDVPLMRVKEVEMVQCSLPLPYEYHDRELRLQKPVLDKATYDAAVVPLRVAFNEAWHCAGNRDPSNLSEKLSALRALLASQEFTTPYEWALAGAGTSNAPLLLRSADVALAAVFSQRYCVHADGVYGVPSLAKFVIEDVCAAGEKMDLALIWRIRTVLFGQQSDEAIRARYPAIDTKKLKYFLASAHLAEDCARFSLASDGEQRGELAKAIQRARPLLPPATGPADLGQYIRQLVGDKGEREFHRHVADAYASASPKLERKSSDVATLPSAAAPVFLPLPLAEVRLRPDSIVAMQKTVGQIKTANDGRGLGAAVIASLDTLQKLLQALQKQAELPVKVAVEAEIDAVKQSVLSIVFESELEPHQYSDQVQSLCDIVYCCEGDEPGSFLSRAQYFGIAYQRPDEERVAELREQLHVTAETREVVEEGVRAGASGAPVMSAAE